MEDVRLSCSSPKRIWLKYGDGRPVSLMFDGDIVDDLVEVVKKELPNELDDSFNNSSKTPLKLIVNAPAPNKRNRKSEETSPHEQYMGDLKRIKKSPSEMVKKFNKAIQRQDRTEELGLTPDVVESAKKSLFKFAQMDEEHVEPESSEVVVQENVPLDKFLKYGDGRPVSLMFDGDD
ncbi:3271_t:CDS:2, partial [Paraglomus occultum]